MGKSFPFFELKVRHVILVLNIGRSRSGRCGSGRWCLGLSRRGGWELCVVAVVVAVSAAVIVGVANGSLLGLNRLDYRLLLLSHVRCMSRMHLPNIFWTRICTWWFVILKLSTYIIRMNTQTNSIKEAHQQVIKNFNQKYKFHCRDSKYYKQE